MIQAPPNLKTQRREQILDAAMMVFGERGFDRGRVKDIARQAGVAPGLIYHYFAGKEALITEMLRSRGFQAELKIALGEAGSSDPVGAVLERICNRFGELLERNAALTRIIVREGHGHPRFGAPLAAVFAEGREALVAFLESRVTSGELRAHDCSVTARALIFAVVFGQFVEMGGRGFREALVDVVVEGVRAR